MFLQEIAEIGILRHSVPCFPFFIAFIIVLRPVRSLLYSLVTSIALFGSFFLFDSTQAQPQKTNLSQHSGTTVIRKAIEHFRTVKTIDSKVRMKCRFFGEEYTGYGFYHEKRLASIQKPAVSPNLFLLVLKIQVDSLSNPENSSSTLKMVANGSYFWKYTNIGNEQRSERVNLETLYDIIAKSNKGNGKDEKSQIADIGGLTSLGGLEGTLMQMEKFYDFENAVVENSKLGSENISVWKVSAKLKPARFEAMNNAMTAGKKSGEMREKTHIPAAMSVYFGKEDLFPYRISYYGGVKENPFDDSPNIDLEYWNVSINGDDIATSTFDYRADGMFEEVTEVYANRILAEE